jgi:hypothetical protein
MRPVPLANSIDCASRLPVTPWLHLQQLMDTYGPENKATVPKGSDPKWRYFWKLKWPSEGDQVGPQKKRLKETTESAPASIPGTDEAEQVAAPPASEATEEPNQVVPEGFPTFKETMEKWGNSMLQSVASVAQLLALGYGLKEDTFRDMLLDGRHLLAPTGALLVRGGIMSDSCLTPAMSKAPCIDTACDCRTCTLCYYVGLVLNSLRRTSVRFLDITTLSLRVEQHAV